MPLKNPATCESQRSERNEDKERKVLVCIPQRVSANSNNAHNEKSTYYCGKYSLTAERSRNVPLKLHSQSTTTRTARLFQTQQNVTVSSEVQSGFTKS